MAKLTPRGRALRWLTTHRRITEQPAGSNRDFRKDGITAAQKRLGGWLVGKAWCGTWHANALLAAGVHGVSWRQASVAMIEDDAKARVAPYGRGWVTPASKDWHKRVLRGDAAVLFGRGVHVETVRSVSWQYRRLGLLVLEGGNTASGNKGSQSNGGGSYRRVRPISAVRGFALVDFPGR
jgi:hypothetical protein